MHWGWGSPGEMLVSRRRHVGSFSVRTRHSPGTCRPVSRGTAGDVMTSQRRTCLNSAVTSLTCVVSKCDYTSCSERADDGETTNDQLRVIHRLPTRVQYHQHHHHHHHDRMYSAHVDLTYTLSLPYSRPFFSIQTYHTTFKIIHVHDPPFC